jgi:pyrroloquinoline quinone biosynthesis protein D
MTPKLAKKARLRFDRHEARWMIVYPERGLVLSESAAAIARRIDGSRTIAEIARELSAEHPGASAEEIERDVRAFVEDLSERGLLESVPR